MNQQKRPLRTAKFTDAEVRDLRQRASREGVDVREEADRFGVAPETVRKILRGDTFRWVPLVTQEEKAAAAREDLAAQAVESQARMAKLFLPGDELAAELAGQPAVPVKMAKVLVAAPWVGQLLGQAVEDPVNNPLEEGEAP